MSKPKEDPAVLPKVEKQVGKLPLCYSAPLKQYLLTIGYKTCHVTPPWYTLAGMYIKKKLDPLKDPLPFFF